MNYNDRKAKATLAIVADSIEQLRKCDVKRYLTECKRGNYAGSGCAYIIENRPELTTIVQETMKGLTK